jgi:PrgI family protein
MKFRVPQFIDIEDKVIGPLTLKQFGYCLGAGGLAFLIWTFISIKFFAILIILPTSGLFLALAFVKFNNRPLEDLLQSAFTYYTGSKIYTWKQPNELQTDSNIDKVVAETTKDIVIAKTSRGKLHDISLGLDVYEHEEKDDSDPRFKA